MKLRGNKQCTCCKPNNKSDCLLGYTLRNCAVILDANGIPKTSCYCCRVGKKLRCTYKRRRYADSLKQMETCCSETFIPFSMWNPAPDECS